MKTTSYDIPRADDFVFTKENRERLDRIVARYPADRKASAVIAALDIGQRQNGGWASQAVIEHVAQVLEMAPIRVYEVASFYTMINTKPVGENLVQVCRTTPCWLRGSDAITGACLKKLGTRLGETTEDGKFTVIEVECLGACANAPMIQVNDDYYEDLTPETMEQILDALAKGDPPKVGPQVDRLTSAPEGGRDTLKDVPPYQSRTPVAVQTVRDAQEQAQEKSDGKGEGAG